MPDGGGLPNAHFPAKGILSIHDISGSKKLNVKSDRRKAKSHTNIKGWMQTGRTPYVVTSETPGPQEYRPTKDPAFEPPLSPMKTKSPTRGRGSPNSRQGATAGRALPKSALSPRAESPRGVGCIGRASRRRSLASGAPLAQAGAH